MAILIRSLHIYPIKSCAGIDLAVSPVSRQGLLHDRRWMLVSGALGFLTQRAVPKMALIRTAIEDGILLVDAPGMATLRIALDDTGEAPNPDMSLPVKVWRDIVPAVSEGDAAARWFSDFLGIDCRMVRMHPGARRCSDVLRIHDWKLKHADVAAGFEGDHVFGFADGFPLLIVNQASLDDLNERLRAKGRSSVPMDRFRPNIVVEGLDAFEEDYTALIEGEGVRMALVKPCTRCGIPNIDQRDASVHDEPGATLVRYRSFDDGVVFGQNAIVDALADAQLRIGSPLTAELDFE